MNRMILSLCLIISLSAYSHNNRSQPVTISHEKHYYRHVDIMAQETFDLFLEELKNTWPDDKKYKIYLKYLLTYKLTVNQLVKITSLITFDNDRIEAITLLYPSVIDKENAMELIDNVNDKSTLIQLLK